MLDDCRAFTILLQRYFHALCFVLLHALPENPWAPKRWARRSIGHSMRAKTGRWVCCFSALRSVLKLPLHGACGNLLLPFIESIPPCLRALSLSRGGGRARSLYATPPPPGFREILGWGHGANGAPFSSVSAIFRKTRRYTNVVCCPDMLTANVSPRTRGPWRGMLPPTK